MSVCYLDAILVLLKLRCNDLGNIFLNGARCLRYLSTRVHAEATKPFTCVHVSEYIRMKTDHGLITQIIFDIERNVLACVAYCRS